MKILFGILAVTSAAWIGNEWKSMCYKNSCALGRAKCCKRPPTTTPNMEFTTTAPEVGIMPIDLNEAVVLPSRSLYSEGSTDTSEADEVIVDMMADTELIVHLKDGDITLDIPKGRSLFNMFSQQYFQQLAKEVQDFDWSTLYSKIVSKAPSKIPGQLRPVNMDNRSKQARNIVTRWGQTMFQRFSNSATKLVKGVQNKFRNQLMNTLLKQLNVVFGAGWEEIQDLAALGGEEIANLLKALQDELHGGVEMVLDYLNFDDGFSIDTLQGDMIKLIMEKLEMITDPDKAQPIHEIIAESKKEFAAILDDAVDKTMSVVFDEVNDMLDRIQYDDGFSIETPKDELIVDLLKNVQSVLDPDGDMKPKALIKMMRKSLKKFAKSFGKMQLMEKIELIIERLSDSDKPLDQAYEFFLQNLNEILNGNKDFEDIIQYVKTELLELALNTVERLEEEIQKLFENHVI